MSGTRIERQLPLILTDLGAGPTPDYTESLLARTAAARQRPGWTFPERWFPMSALSERMATTPRVPWRTIGVIAILLLALVAGALFIAGNQPKRLPAPFGPAGNGVIPFTAGGDIYLGDPVTGATRLLAGGPDIEGQAGFSPDGTRLAFVRQAAGDENAPVDLYVVNQDGSGLSKITSQPIDRLLWAAWAPNGRRIALVHTVNAINVLDMVDASGSGAMQRIPTVESETPGLVTGVPDGIDIVKFRPPDGRQIAYRALVDGKWGFFASDADGTNVRTLREPTMPAEIDLSYGDYDYSPDGSRIFYQSGVTDPGNEGCCQLWVMNADGSDAHEFVPPSSPTGPGWRGQPVVSPDGSRVAYWGFENDSSTQQVSVARTDGTGEVIKTGPEMATTRNWVWAPDSSKILMYPNEYPDNADQATFLLDPDGGPFTTVPWKSIGDLDWQRVATD